MAFSPYMPQQRSEPTGNPTIDNYPIPNSPWTPPGLAGKTPQDGVNYANQQVDKFGNKVDTAVKGAYSQLNQKFMQALPYAAVGGTALAALFGQDNDALWGTQAEANDAADAGVKAQPMSER